MPALKVFQEKIFAWKDNREKATLAMAILAVTCTVLTVPIAFLSAGFAYKQWQASDQAARISEQARKDALNATAQQRSDFKTAAEQQKKDSDLALQNQKDKADAAYKIAERSAKAAESNAQIARLALQVSERPWVGVTYHFVDNIAADKKIVIQVSFQNTGKTPAFDFMGGAFVLIGSPMSDEAASQYIDREGKLDMHKSISVLVPNQLFSLTVETPGPVNQLMIDNMNAEKLTLWIVGHAEYKDYFKNIHKFEFCAVSKSGGALQGCDAHNSAD